MPKKQNPNIRKAAPFGLSDCIGYETGSIVSKTLITKPAGNVTLFSFDAHAGLSEHTAPFDALVQALDGKAVVKIAGKPFAVKAGQAIILPAHKPHALEAVTRFKMMLVMIKK
jgi:quercetin dioxygenase-like cupin family protein